MALTETMPVLKGGSFLLEQPGPNDIFTPEDLTDEHSMIRDTVREFVEREIEPNIDRIESLDIEFTKELLRKCGELGLLSANLPEQYGGLGLDQVTAIILSEELGYNGSFAVSYSVQTGIGLFPILYFGTDDQRKKYIEKLGTGELFSAYALTEAGSGSDALAAKTRAELSPDGSQYILNGEKMWISNAAWADIFIVFAKVDGEKFSAFIVPRDAPGVSTGAEEKKMGIKGSSTRVVILNDAAIPAENLLGEVGRGHVIAFNTLNIGRFKLGAACLGGCKVAFQGALRYSKERHQFGVPICAFGMIKHKIAEMVTRIYALESATYRTAGLIDSHQRSVNWNNPEATAKKLAGVEECALECSIMKVCGSEILDFVVDESVQIFGGYGYSQEYRVQTHYVDSRINRLYEGTSEINRLVILNMLLKKGMKGTLPVLEKVQEVTQALMAGKLPQPEGHGALANERFLLENCKKIGLMLCGGAAMKYGNDLVNEEEILGIAADIIMDIYLMESVILRTEKRLTQETDAECAVPVAATRVFANDAVERIRLAVQNALPKLAEGDALEQQYKLLKVLTRHAPLNTIELRRQIADAAIEAEDYPLG